MANSPQGRNPPVTAAIPDFPRPAPLLILLGPTGSGKSALGLEIAASFDGEIINCDSLQFYRGFDIGTAKPTPDDRRGVPHHLFDALDAESVYSAGDYGRAARQVIAQVSARGRLPIVVGGTGFYLRALLDGLPELPGRDPDLRQRLMAREERCPGSLHRLLRRLDPAAGGRVHTQDLQKVIRALEIRLLTRLGLPQPESARPLEGFQVLQIGLAPERARLVAAISARTAKMFQQGLVEEVRDLLNRGASGKEKPFEAIGYKQVLKHLQGDLSLADAISSTEIETRQYAKRQVTWHRKDPRIRWLSGFGSDLPILEQAFGWVRELLQLEAGPRPASESPPSEGG